MLIPQYCSFTVPGPPENVTTKPVSQTSVIVSWTPPVEKNGILTNYTITWQAGADMYNNTVVVDSNSSSYTVEGLQTCLMYNFSVAASISLGGGEPASTDGTTELGGINGQSFSENGIIEFLLIKVDQVSSFMILTDLVYIHFRAI